jgi:uncharacterized membrane protein
MSTKPNPPSAMPVVLDFVPPPRSISVDAPWQWLAAGWRDIQHVPAVSLTYGAIFAFAALGLILGLWAVGAQSLFFAFAGGFLLIGPFFAVGLYEASRLISRGEPVHLFDVARAGFSARGQLAFFGAVLLFAFMAWMHLALLLMMLFIGTSGAPPPNEVLQVLLFAPRALAMLVVGTLIGGAIAVLIFAISAVAVPMLLVSHVDAVTAACASLAAVYRNPKPMALWAILIAGIMALAFATLLVGLVVAFPLIAHATWHAYADIYGAKD